MVAQLGIEPMTTRFLVVVLATKLLGPSTVRSELGQIRDGNDGGDGDDDDGELTKSRLRAGSPGS